MRYRISIILCICFQLSFVADQIKQDTNVHDIKNSYSKFMGKTC